MACSDINSNINLERFSQPIVSCQGDIVMPRAIAAQKKAGFLEKLHFFSREFLDYCAYVCEGEPARETFTQKLYAPMVSSSKVLEDFLDFHGAKNSSEWYYYRELVSSVRSVLLSETHLDPPAIL